MTASCNACTARRRARRTAPGAPARARRHRPARRAPRAPRRAAARRPAIAAGTLRRVFPRRPVLDDLQLHGESCGSSPRPLASLVRPLVIAYGAAEQAPRHRRRRRARARHYDHCREFRRCFDGRRRGWAALRAARLDLHGRIRLHRRRHWPNGGAIGGPDSYDAGNGGGAPRTRQGGRSPRTAFSSLREAEGPATIPIAAAAPEAR